MAIAVGSDQKENIAAIMDAWHSTVREVLAPQLCYYI